jgi:hypothetical protein
VRDEVVRVGAFQHHDPGLRTGFQHAEQGHQVAHQLRPDQVHRRRVNHHAQHALAGLGDAQRAVRLDRSRRCVGIHRLPGGPERAVVPGGEVGFELWLWRHE